jgi:hypothetical protein
MEGPTKKDGTWGLTLTCPVPSATVQVISGKRALPAPGMSRHIRRCPLLSGRQRWV